MGLHVHSLLEIPADAKRSYYVYLLDYGWKEPLSEALADNFQEMAELASKNDAVVIRNAGRGVHFYDDVFSYHNLNGEDGEELLPAILITDRNPHDFKESHGPDDSNNSKNKNFKIIVFPLRKYCKSTTDVAKYVDRIFRDIIEKKDLADFKVAKEMKKGFGKALVSGLLLQPNIAGVGYDLKPLIEYFDEK
jgi:hypothetical protein